MEEDILWFLISFIIGLAIIWAIGAFITFNLLWFWTTWLGRLIAIVLVVGLINACAENNI